MDIRLLAQKFYDYSIFIKGYSEKTIRRYKYVIELYCKLCNITSIQDVSQENIYNLFQQGRIKRQWSPNTFIIFHKSLNVFFDWCKKENLLPINPIASIEKPKQPLQLPRGITKQKATDLLEVVYNLQCDSEFLRCRNHAIFATFLYAGLRLSECLNLNFTDVDLENKTLFVRLGKGGKDRVIPIANPLENSLRQYIAIRKKLNKTSPKFFTSFIQNVGFTENGLRHLVNKIRHASKIRFSIHQLRHTFATLMLEGGCDIYSLSKIMGHSDIKTTTIYLSASIDHLRSQINKHPLDRSNRNN